MEFGTPHGHTPSVGGQTGNPLRRPSVSDLVIEAIICWLTVADMGYEIVSCGLKLTNKSHIGDGTLVTNSVEDMISLLGIVRQFSSWSGIRLNVAKCKITA